MAEPNTRLSGVSRNCLLSNLLLKNWKTVKFSDINARLNEIEKNIKKSVTEEVNESITSIKNTIIDALKKENLRLQNWVKKLEDQVSETDQRDNILDQYNRRNNLEIHGAPPNVTDDELEGKVIDIFSCLSI